ncbi:hypothetical protein EGW08_009681, partial [Elysia chlorotica]
MDVDTLIASVYERPPVWDKKHKLHRNRNVIDRLWQEISNEMQMEETALRKKWKYLRDNFATEYSKRPVGRSRAEAKNIPQSKWAYFEQLMFLKDMVTPRASSGSISRRQPFSQELHEHLEPNVDLLESPEQTLQADLFVENGAGAVEDAEDLQSASDPQAGQPNLNAGPSTSRGIKRESSYEDYNNKMCKNKQERRRDDEDADVMFWKALLPHIRKIPAHKKLRFQNKILSVVDEFVYNNSTI